MDHPIENIMRTTMESLKDMIDVNTVVGDAVETDDGTVIIPISRVSVGFISGGGEYECKTDDITASPSANDRLPFGGGAGAGISLSPMGFLVVGNGGVVRMLPANVSSAVDRVIEMAPQMVAEVKKIISDCGGSGNGSASGQCCGQSFPQTYSSATPPPPPGPFEPQPPTAQNSSVQGQPAQSTANSEL